MKLSVCIPMYNERTICVDTAQTLRRAVSDFCTPRGYDWEIVFCDDGSTDGSADVLKEAIAARDLSHVRCVGYADNRGKGAAVRTAVLATTGDVVCYTDCDLAYGTNVIAQGAERILRGEKILLGSRNLKKDGYAEYTLLRRIASKAYIKLIALVAGFRLSDSQCGFKCLDGETARRIFALCTIDGFSFDLEMIKIAQKLGYPLSEMPVRIINHRESKIHVVRDACKMMSDLGKIKKRVKKLESLKTCVRRRRVFVQQ